MAFPLLSTWHLWPRVQTVCAAASQPQRQNRGLDGLAMVFEHLRGHEQADTEAHAVQLPHDVPCVCDRWTTVGPAKGLQGQSDQKANRVGRVILQ